MAEPSITDWISSIGTLIGIPTAAWGIIKLFRKNKEQERKISSLESLATAQNKVVLKMGEQVEELSRQTSEFQYQTELMKEANEITRLNLEIQSKNYLKSAETEAEKLELQKLERLSNIKPHFTFSGGTSSPSGFTVRLLNKGNTAREVSLNQIGNDFVFFKQIDNTKEFDKNEKLEISGNANPEKTYFNTNQVPFEFEVSFSDIDGNKYQQLLSRKQNRYKISNPELIDEKK